MNGFKFKLNKVLEVKDVEFRQQQKDLSDAAQQKHKAHEKLAAKRNSTEKYAKGLDDVQIQNAGNMHLGYDHYHFLLEEVKQQHEHVVNLGKKEDAEREKLIRVQRECKVLEKLKEKEFEKFQADIAKQVQNSIDELANMHVRRLAK